MHTYFWFYERSADIKRSTVFVAKRQSWQGSCWWLLDFFWWSTALCRLQVSHALTFWNKSHIRITMHTYTEWVHLQEGDKVTAQALLQHCVWDSIILLNTLQRYLHSDAGKQTQQLLHFWKRTGMKSDHVTGLHHLHVVLLMQRLHSPWSPRRYFVTMTIPTVITAGNLRAVWFTVIIIIFVEVWRMMWTRWLLQQYCSILLLVACRMLLITRKQCRRKYWVKTWLTTRTVCGAYHSLFNDLLSTDSLTFKNFMWIDLPSFEDLLSATT